MVGGKEWEEGLRKQRGWRGWKWKVGVKGQVFSSAQQVMIDSRGD
jgi:hypothetical protein